MNGPPSLSVDGRFAGWLSSGSSAPRLVLYDLAERREAGRSGVGAARCRAFTWTHLPGVGLVVADPDGTENWSLHRVRVETAEWTPLGGPSAVRARIAGLSERRPAEVVLSTDGAGPGLRDFVRVSLLTGATTVLMTGSDHSAVYFDRDLRLRLTETVTPDGSRELRHAPAPGGGVGALFLRVPHEDALVVRVLRFADDGAGVYLVLPDGPDGVRLAEVGCVPGEPAGVPRTVRAVRGGDFSTVLFAEDTGRPDLVHVEREQRVCEPLDEEWEPRIERLRDALGTEPVVLDRRGDRLLVAAHRPERDARYFVHDTATDDTWPLSKARPGQGPAAVECRPVRVPLRDGAHAVTYVTRGDRERLRGGPGPAVLLVHGGPWRRSRWEYAERRVWLAEQGCTVIEPNFRGSTGFGSAWINAADRQWGAAMQDDLEDTLDWAVAEGLADPDRIALLGGSYGGYAVLQMAATTRRTLRCVVATSPLTDLVRFLAAPPAFWQAAAPMLRRRVGDPDVPEQLRALTEASPVNRPEGFRCPVLLVHGAQDSRVPAEMATRMFMGLAQAGRDATLALFPDEGHEVVSTGNRSALDSLIARYLDEWLGGPGAAEPGRDRTAVPGDTTVKLFDSPRAVRRKAAPAPTSGADHGTSPDAQ
ncbi:alpha/beta fold hydrolase [Streptomyces sp. NBC_00247]|uniref:alpha/beta hydrolase family protein n=1 Tax=Streptomyces sp. NBC_00247 TaxID=2975689 RepID=UPI002E2A05DD|nr:alpha/beta fold hydrolase [Streptomyces sp. NBC_00247]